MYRALILIALLSSCTVNKYYTIQGEPVYVWPEYSLSPVYSNGCKMCNPNNGNMTLSVLHKCEPYIVRYDTIYH
jgi:hypothetical protein